MLIIKKHKQSIKICLGGHCYECIDPVVDFNMGNGEIHFPYLKYDGCKWRIVRQIW